MPHRPPTHRRPSAAKKPQAHHDTRVSSTDRGYGYAWQQLRARHLEAEPLCRACLVHGVTTAALHVDHIVPRARGGSDDPDNLQSLCAPCHSKKTASEDGGYGRKAGDSK